jgi:hypothetical protein
MERAVSPDPIDLYMWARKYFCATVGAVDEATIKAYLESQKWDEDDQGFTITAPT